ncbi:Six-hairpin glycosidase-like protein [Venturia nashicola]|uniref:Six-hairpin glycosidase-like protein n=1 Tax=Venturia nashicola TaxID=86259 RepID=A0A4Z1PNV8_9PEZI|nr:Six-hairpin glycosidase-like protein [Venturia nashicola]
MKAPISYIFACLAAFITGGIAQNSSYSPHQQKYSSWMASSIISRGQGVMTGKGGSSELLQAGITQKAFRRVVEQYPDAISSPQIRSYITKSVDSTLGFLGNATKDAAYPLDRLSNGNNLVTLYDQTGNASYKAVIESLRKSIDLQKRNEAGGLWYYVYPNWSYLDGMYSLAPFYTLYTKLYDQTNTTAVDDIFYQIDALWARCFDNSTGLLVHGYDYSKTAVWANPITGASPHVWVRSLGWYMMSLVDTLEVSPLSHQSPAWKALLSKFQQLSKAVAMAVDPTSGAWWQVLDQPGRAGNYIESSGSAMFVYSLLKGVRLGYVSDYGTVATHAYRYIVDNFVVKNGSNISYNGTVTVCSLNSTASYEVSQLADVPNIADHDIPQYYISQPILYDSVLGSGAFILASIEHEIYTSI